MSLEHKRGERETIHSFISHQLLLFVYNNACVTVCFVFRSSSIQYFNAPGFDAIETGCSKQNMNVILLQCNEIRQHDTTWCNTMWHITLQYEAQRVIQYDTIWLQIWGPRIRKQTLKSNFLWLNEYLTVESRATIVVCASVCVCVSVQRCFHLFRLQTVHGPHGVIASITSHTSTLSVLLQQTAQWLHAVSDPHTLSLSLSRPTLETLVLQASIRWNVDEGSTGGFQILP